MKYITMDVTRTQLEQVVLISTIGACIAIRQKAMTIEEAQRFLFSPKTMQLIVTRGVSDGVMDVIHWATELEDLHPSEVDGGLDHIINLASAHLRELEREEYSPSYWLSALVNRKTWEKNRAFWRAWQERQEAKQR